MGQLFVPLSLQTTDEPGVYGYSQPSSSFPVDQQVSSCFYIFVWNFKFQSNKILVITVIPTSKKGLNMSKHKNSSLMPPHVYVYIHAHT